MNITVRTAIQTETIRAEHNTVWVVKIRPVLQTDVDGAVAFGGDGSAYRLIAQNALVSIDSATASDGTVIPINGKPATDRENYGHALGVFSILARRISEIATDKTAIFEGELGNSSPAPV